MQFPGHIIQVGEADAALVAQIRARLGQLGYQAPASFDAEFRSIVRMYQAQHVDAGGRQLRADGKIGPLTWSALFDQPPSVAPASSLGGAALLVAQTQVGVMEVPPGSNRGPVVDQYLASVGCPPGLYWCMAFVNWCFQRAAADNGLANDFPRTPGCLDAWRTVTKSAPNRIVTRAQAIANPAIVKPGFVFILDHGGGNGHTGIVREAVGGALRTIEGNSNAGGSSNGVGVFDRTGRSVTENDLKGFLDFTFA